MVHPPRAAIPRTTRVSAAGDCYHTLDHGNARTTVFHKERDYETFLEMVADAPVRVRMRVVTSCLMPNHFHPAPWPRGDGDLSRWIRRLRTTHVRRYLRHSHRGGHIWQGRFKPFPIQGDDHLRVVLRPSERNPPRAGPVERAELWPWSSLSPPGGVPGPVPQGKGWTGSVNAAMTESGCAAIRESIRRDRPFGTEMWVRETGAELRLEASPRDRGRPHRRVETGPAAD